MTAYFEPYGYARVHASRCLSESVYLRGCLSLALSHFHYLSLSRCLSVCVSVSPRIFRPLTLSVHVSMSHPLALSISMSRSLPRSSLRLPFSLDNYISASVCLSASAVCVLASASDLSLSSCLCLSVSVSLSLALSICPFTHRKLNSTHALQAKLLTSGAIQHQSLVHKCAAPESRRPGLLSLPSIRQRAALLRRYARVSAWAAASHDHSPDVPPLLGLHLQLLADVRLAIERCRDQPFIALGRELLVLQQESEDVVGLHVEAAR